ncbi:MAG: DUF1080 domain-containing protein [Cyclobacteriaceae bacterium]|nr:DUF1080 domain-containing protein [Cyclobacteriaceae bacterium]
MRLKIILPFTLLTILFFNGILLTGEKEPKLKKIFNGKNLKGWKAPEGNIWWTAKGGILTAKSDPGKTGTILWTEGEYTDFIIQADFKFGQGTVDSGIFLRAESQQIQIGESGSLKRDLTCSPYIPGKGYPVEASNVQNLLKKTDWNTIKVKATGSVYTVWLNGEKTLEYDSDTALEKGPVGLQLHPGRDMQIEFRNILFAEL